MVNTPLSLLKFSLHKSKTRDITPGHSHRLAVHIGIHLATEGGAGLQLVQKIYKIAGLGFSKAVYVKVF